MCPLGKCQCNSFTHEAPKSSRSSFKGVRAFRVELKFRNVGFCGGRKTGEKPSEQGRESTTNSTHMTPSPGIESGPHWWEASALTTALSLLPRWECHSIKLDTCKRRHTHAQIAVRWPRLPAYRKILNVSVNNGKHGARTLDQNCFKQLAEI